MHFFHLISWQSLQNFLSYGWKPTICAKVLRPNTILPPKDGQCVKSLSMHALKQYNWFIFSFSLGDCVLTFYKEKYVGVTAVLCFHTPCFVSGIGNVTTLPRTKVTRNICYHVTIWLLCSLLQQGCRQWDNWYLIDVGDLNSLSINWNLCRGYWIFLSIPDLTLKYI